MNEQAKKIVFPDPAERTPAILVVDDEPLIRAALADFLQECGFKTLEASHAQDAVAILEGSRVIIDLVISDVVMPGDMDGFGLAQWIQKNRPGVRVVLCSGDSRKAKIAQDVCAGEPFVAKPYDLHMVVLQIRQLLASRAQAR